jgi:hypothetical protein
MLKNILLAGVAGLFVLPGTSLAMPVEYVRICSEAGPGWFYIPGTETCVNPETGKTVNPATNEAGTIDAIKGVALSLALPAASIDEGKSFGAAVNVGTFGGASAIGVCGAFRATDGLTVNGAVGVGFDGGPVGGRAGVNFSW